MPIDKGTAKQGGVQHAACSSSRVEKVRDGRAWGRKDHLIEIDRVRI